MSEPARRGRKVVAAVDDVFFISKLENASRATGVPLQYVANREELLAAAGAGSLVLLDLDAPAYDPINVIPELRALRGVRTIAFLSHVETDLARRARDAGADHVMARSRFFAQIADLLKESRA